MIARTCRHDHAFTYDERESIVTRKPRNRPHPFLHDLKWTAILWCAGFGATALLALPFHFLVMAMMRK